MKIIKRERPLVHCINNIVSANDCANLLLAVGASPMMAQAPAEMTEITKLAASAVLNTGTPDSEKYEACSICGIESKALGKPVVLDPVGVGASGWRMSGIYGMLRDFRPSLIRANLSEANALLDVLENGLRSMPDGDPFTAVTAAAPVSLSEKGVDSEVKFSPEKRAEIAERLAGALKTVVLITGNEDIVTYGGRTEYISGGSDRMPLVTGSGCMLSCLCGAFLAAETDAFSAAAEASRFWKACAEKAEELSGGRRLSSVLLIDAAAELAGSGN